MALFNVGDMVRWDEGDRVFHPIIDAIKPDPHKIGFLLLMRWIRGFASWQWSRNPALSIKHNGLWQTPISIPGALHDNLC